MLPGHRVVHTDEPDRTLLLEMTLPQEQVLPYVPASLSPLALQVDRQMLLVMVDDEYEKSIRDREEPPSE